MNFIIIFQSVIVLINTALAVIAYLHAPKERVNKLFVFLMLFINLWIIGLMVFKINGTIIGSRLAFAGASLLSVFLLRFCSSFPIKFRSKIINFFTNFTLFFGILLAFLSIFTNSIAQGIKSLTPPELNYGSLYPVFSAFYLLTVLVSLALLVKQVLNAGGIQRKQAFFLFFGLLVATILGTVTNLVLPLITGNSFYSQFGPLTVTIFIVSAFYAILKHGLFNIRIIATEIFVVILSLILLLEIFPESQTPVLIFRTLIFGAVVIFGILLIRSVLKEISAREKIQSLATDLQLANVELKRLDRVKSEFLSIASHQLRTPLTAIKGYSSMALEGSFGNLSLQVKDAVSKIFESSKQLVTMVDDFLNVSRIEAGEMNYEFSLFNLNTVIDGVVNDFLANSQKARELNLKFSPTANDLNIRADKNKITQVVTNLIDNAVKYTPEGFVKISTALNAAQKIILVKVEDSGIGIPKEAIPRLFQKFSRSEKSSHINTSGSGLGLYVAKRIVNDHEGKIWAESEGQDMGSVFCVELPAV